MAEALFFPTSTYARDRALFKRLGLRTFTALDHEQRDLGRVEVGDDGSWVDVSVTCLPAQFWTFDVWCAATDKRTRFSTGSGTLSEYWPTAERVASGVAVEEAAGGLIADDMVAVEAVW